MKEKNTLNVTHPELVKEWHPTKNGDLNPCNITYGSKKKVWWVCDEGHEWIAQIANRSKPNGTGCPICSNREVLKGYNDLATKMPELAKEWHPTKNGDLKATDVTSSSGKHVWWQCTMDSRHEWTARITNRSREKEPTGCPYCSNKKVLKGYNDLATKMPELAKEWHPTKNGVLKATDVTYGSKNKVWWKCNHHDYDWIASILDRSKGTGCPVCAKMYGTSFVEQSIVYYLSKIFKEVYNRFNIHVDGESVEVDIYVQDINLSIEYDGFKWHKNSNDKDLRKNMLLYNKTNLIRVRDEGLERLPYCISLIVNEDCKKKYSHADRTIKKIIEYIEVEYKDNYILDVNTFNDRFEILSLYKSYVKVNSLLEKKPELVKEWHPTKNGDLKPEYFTVNSKEKVWWVCDEGHEWTARIADRSKPNGTGCPICSNRQVLKGYNDLETVNPELAKEWHSTKNGDLKPSDVTVGSRKKVWWICNKGHEWLAYIMDRSRGVNCPICANKQVLKGYNDLETVNPELAKEWHSIKNGDLKPSDVTVGSNKRVWWYCYNHDYEWPSRVADRKKLGCKRCKRKIK